MIGGCLVGFEFLWRSRCRYKRIMSLQRKVISAAAPPLGVVSDGSSSVDGSLEKSMGTGERMETFDKAKMAKILRACLLAKYLRNDNVPCELHQVSFHPSSNRAVP